MTVCYAAGVRILVDYRPALRNRTGVGEYVHELIRAYAHQSATTGDELQIFTSSWKDRPARGLDAELGVRVIDHRVPVRVLNYLWHHVGWPPAEIFGGPLDVVHSPHPLLIPARAAAQVVTIHDLFFLSHPEGTRAEIRRDYPALAAAHARAADAVITSTHHGAALIEEELGADRRHIHVCPPGPPAWRSLGHAPNVPTRGYVLFVGTLEPRKNVGFLLDGFSRVLEHRPDVQLVLAGRTTPSGSQWLDRLARAPLAGHALHRGYVPAQEREALFAGARVLVLPSLDEGFGLPVLEAMSAGVPVIASNRGSLPEVVGTDAMMIDPADVDSLVAALRRVLDDEQFATDLAQRGLLRARAFSWSAAATTLRRAYLDAIAHRAQRVGVRARQAC